MQKLQNGNKEGGFNPGLSTLRVKHYIAEIPSYINPNEEEARADIALWVILFSKVTRHPCQLR